mmetsp:Transcript_12426/g.32820  ORF Transcript_12426/g.32820 Transcript_12426/m.32820 type:complete len:254 (-) Transcript_12426:217-978(-)
MQAGNHGLGGIRNPIAAAYLLAKDSLAPLSCGRVRPMTLCGSGARAYAAYHGLDTSTENGYLVSQEAQNAWKKFTGWVHQADHQQQQQQQQRQSIGSNDSPLLPRQLDDAGAEVCISTEDFSATAIGWRQTDDSAGIKGKEATHPQRQNTSATQHEAPSEGGMQGMQAHSKDAEEEVVDTAAAIQAAEAAEEQHRCRLCKLTVELDRVVAAQEAGYVAGLFAMLHAEEMAKSDLLVGIPKEQAEWACMHSMFK